MSTSLTSDSRLLNASELIEIYGMSIFNDVERRECFTFNDQETKALHSFKSTEDAVYFALSLVFFKFKKTLVEFSYRETTAERQHIMERYFNNRFSPKSLPSDYNRISRIENKVLELCGYQRFTGDVANNIKKELMDQAAHHPRQRQLCKALLRLCAKHRAAIPAYSTVQTIVSATWNDEMDRVTASYLRYTRKPQRDMILALLNKTDHLHNIISIKKEMKGFNTTELDKEMGKHEELHPIFTVAKEVLPKLKLPMTTISYYTYLIHYYNGPRLKQINPLTTQLYLLCYCFTRFQKLIAI